MDEPLNQAETSEGRSYCDACGCGLVESAEGAVCPECGEAAE
jgi:predicted RNA-binding Zn-ribbon protein involved in translation (DUF1610 family)